MQVPFQRRIQLENIINCRDLGGYLCKDGSVTQFGRLLRCGIPRDPTQRDMEILAAHGIKTVIDLRGDMEAVERPSAFLGHKDFTYHQISLLEVNPAITNAAVLLSEIYKNSVEKYSGNYAKVFKTIATIETPALFHCFLGKDRTGILASMILDLAGVWREDIIADYQVSGTYLNPFYKREIEMNSGLIWENNDDHLLSEPKNIAMLLDYIDEKYGGVRGYLQAAGVTQEEIEKVGRLLL
ncbi:MAG: tyrosine-protein phosphatase [Eubacteriales bacterium]